MQILRWFAFLGPLLSLPPSFAAGPAPLFSDPLQLQKRLESGVSLSQISEASSRSRDQLIQDLKQKKVTIQNDLVGAFKPNVLVFLNSFFSLFPPQEPLRIASGIRAGTQLAWKDQGILFLNTNVGERLAATQLAKIKTQLNSKSEAGSVGNSFVLTFSNELFFQMTRLLLSREDLVRAIESGFHLTVSTVDRNDQAFSKEELVFILKQLMDLPGYVTSRWGLVRMARAADGLRLPGFSLAQYNLKTETILFSDLAFAPDKAREVGGEGTILHEVGHAVWKKMSMAERQSFATLSWSPSERDWIPRGQMVNFISEYSARSVEEDFAEHFSYYVNKPLLMKNKTPDKFRWFREHLFSDVEYFEETAENARTHVSSEQPDHQPPTLLKPIEQAVAVSAARLSETMALVSLTIEGLSDDLSGVATVSFEFIRAPRVKDRKDPAIPRIRITLQDTDLKDPARHLWSGQSQVNLKDFEGGTYTLATLQASDKAGNDVTFQVSSPQFELPLSDKIQRVAPPEIWSQPQLAFQSLQIEDVRSEKHETVFYLTGPLGELQDPAFSTSLVFGFEAPRQQLNIEFAAATESPTFRRIPGNRFRVGPFVIPSNLPEDQFVLRYIRAFTNASDRYKSAALSYTVERKELAVAHKGFAGKVVPVELAVQDLVLSAERSEGATKIRVKLPVSGLTPNGKNLGWFTVQGPTGKLRQTQFSESDIKTGQDGARYLDLALSLPDHHESGIYELREVMVWEGPTPSQIEPSGQLPFGIQNFKSRQERFLQRGLRKTVQINPELNMN